MAKPGRNDLCPCGSGKKYKKCCEGTERARTASTAGAAGTYTGADRTSAFSKLELFIDERLGPEDDAAFDELWEVFDGRDVDLDEHDDRLSNDAYDIWFAFDRPLDDGALVVDRFLEQAPALTAGERAFLLMLRASSMHLYEVVDVVPGSSLTLRDVLEGGQVTVHERSGSRSLGRNAWIAARLNPRGPSGEPEIEAGPLPVSPFHQEAMRDQLSAARERYLHQHAAEGTGPDLDLTAFYKGLPPFFHQAWVSDILDPAIPELRTTDGERNVITRVTFEVTDAAALVSALAAAGERGIEPSGESRWIWSGNNRHGKPTIFGWMRLEGDRGVFKLECHSVERGERGRALVEELAGAAVRHQATTHEDAVQALRESLRQERRDRRAGKKTAADAGAEKKTQLPKHLLEELTLDHLAQHYRGWVDEPVPALDGETPRAAAAKPSLRPRVAELIRGIEGMYQVALRDGEPAYDPSWMWAELGLMEWSAGATDPSHPPPLAHERIAELVPGIGDLARSVAGRVRAEADFRHTRTVVTPDALRLDLDVQRFLREADRDGPFLTIALPALVNHELHLRKVFWVDESLAYTLDQTDADLPASEIRLPFPAFAVVFTDRQVLSMAERLIAGQPSLPLSGHFLRVVTVYVNEEQAPERALRLTFAFDALGPDLPHLAVHRLVLGERSPLDGYFASAAEVGARDPLRGLLRVTVNAILFATGAGIEPEIRPAPERPPLPSGEKGGEARAPAPAPRYSSDGVFFLPGAIEISRVRRMQELERSSAGRTLLHRFLVRGHWRRAAPSWADQRARWIQPYWKGPDMAAVIERAYKLKP